MTVRLFSIQNTNCQLHQKSAACWHQYSKFQCISIIHMAQITGSWKHSNCFDNERWAIGSNALYRYP